MIDARGPLGFPRLGIGAEIGGVIAGLGIGGQGHPIPCGVRFCARDANDAMAEIGFADRARDTRGIFLRLGAFRAF